MERRQHVNPNLQPYRLNWRSIPGQWTNYWKHIRIFQKNVFLIENPKIVI